MFDEDEVAAISKRIQESCKRWVGEKLEPNHKELIKAEIQKTIASVLGGLPGVSWRVDPNDVVLDIHQGIVRVYFKDSAAKIFGGP